MATGFVSFFTLRRFGPRTLNPGGQRAGWHKLCSSGPRRQRRRGWNSRNLGQTGCSRSRDPDTGSLPLCQLPDDVYLRAVPGGDLRPWPRSKARGFALDLSAAWAERSQQTRPPAIARTGVEWRGPVGTTFRATQQLESGRRAAGGWGAAAAVSMVVPSRSQRLAVLQGTPERPLQPRDPGIPACGRGGSQSWLLSRKRVGK